MAAASCLTGHRLIRGGMVWVMVAIGCFLVVCILVMLQFLFN